MNLQSIKQRNTKNNILIDQKIDDINRLYQEGLSLTKIAEQLGIHRKALTRLFKNNNEASRRGFFLRKKIWFE